MVLVPHCRTDPRAVKGVALRVRARDIVREKEATVTRRRHGLRRVRARDSSRRRAERERAEAEYWARVEAEDV